MTREAMPVRAVLCGFSLSFVIAVSAIPSAPTWAAQARTTCPEPAAADAFFPQGEFHSQRSDLDAFVREWYSKHLRAMGEPSLSCGLQAEGEVYRFLWLRTFHNPIAVRITRTADGAALAVTELTGAGGYEPGAIGTHHERALSSAEWNSLVTALAAVDFWNMPTQPPPTNTVGLDGAQWILEGHHAGTYHVVDRWSPHSGTYRDTCLKFIELARHSVSDVY